jgi:hypothetical protein
MPKNIQTISIGAALGTILSLLLKKVKVYYFSTRKYIALEAISHGRGLRLVSGVKGGCA